MFKKYYYSWKECLIDIQTIARQVSLSDFAPDVIVGVSRGGLVPAVALSHWFKLPMVLFKQLCEIFLHGSPINRNRHIKMCSLWMMFVMEEKHSTKFMRKLKNFARYRNLPHCGGTTNVILLHTFSPGK